MPPLDKGSAEERALLWKRRLAPPRRFKNALGTMALSDMWRGGYSNIDQLKNWKRYVHTFNMTTRINESLTSGRKSDVTSLYEEVKAIDADEEDDKAMGDVAPEKLIQNEEVRPVSHSLSHMILPRLAEFEGLLNPAPDKPHMASTSTAHTDRHSTMQRLEG